MTPEDVATIGRAINEIVAPLRARIADLERGDAMRVKSDAGVMDEISAVRKEIAGTRERVAELGGSLDVLKSARHDDRRIANDLAATATIVRDIGEDLDTATGRIDSIEREMTGAIAKWSEDIEASIEDRTLMLAFGGHVKELRIPIPIHRGKYETGKAYEQADEVALHGCTWRAKADKPSGEPGASADWLLVAKAGGTKHD